jgi:nucleotide-binding universal stress UspA family protein
MSTNRTGHVLVATSGSAASKSAIAFAARTAASRGLSLELVHVVTPTVAVGPYGVTPDVAVRQAGREVLARGEELARRIAPHVDVTTTMLIGSRPDAIVDKAHDADLVVVGGPSHDLMGRLWTGSTVTGVAARATCPVAIVPAGCERPTRRQILVGLKSTRHAARLLAAGFAIASQTDSELRILHAWQMLSPYDNAVAERLPTPEWELEEGRAIEAMLIDLRMAYPNVPARVDLVHGQSAYTLVEASRDADLLVVSRPVHGGYVHHLGATARSVIRDSHCPILVVPPADATGGRIEDGAAVAVAP